ncbi:MAG: hypothetical protein ACYTFG_00370 [Planctomycetota bacterium]
MKLKIAATALFAVLCATATAGDGEKKGGSAIEKLKKILKKMETVEQLLAKSQLSDSEKKQAEVIKDLRKKVEEGKLKEGEVLDEIDKQLKVVVKRMKDIDLDIDKIIQTVKMMQGQSQGSGMEWKDNPSKAGEKQKHKRKDKNERDLKEMRKDGQKPKESKGEQDKNSGKDPAKKPYSAKGSGPDGAAPRAAGTGRWGSLPLKEFQEALASGKVTVPEKYRALIQKYLAMLAEEGKKKD